MNKLYGERNLKELGQHFTNHLSAMTSENLHSKFDIAAELAYRDSIIEKLNNDIEHYIVEIEGINDDNNILNDEIYSLNSLVDDLRCEARYVDEVKEEDNLISEINDLNNEINDLNNEILYLNEEIKRLTEQIDSLIDDSNNP